MTHSWRPSEEQRRCILLLEALGLLHDIGKLSDCFLQSEEPNPSVEYAGTLVADPCLVYPDCSGLTDQKAAGIIGKWQRKATDGAVVAPFKEYPDLTRTLQAVEFTCWDGNRYDFAELVALATRPRWAKEDWATVLGKDMQPALLVGKLHGSAHIEKKGQPDQNKQPYSATYSTTPFGVESRIPVETEGGLSSAFAVLPMQRIEEITSHKRKTWLGEMKALMGRGIADTRRPHNDVTLWDWGFCVATMTKAAAAWIVRNGWPSDLSKIRWRTLCLNLNLPRLYSRSDKISDLLGLRLSLEESFQQAQELIEGTYGIANCFYHDETGAYYMFPDFVLDGDLCQAIRSCFPNDLQPQIRLEDPVTAKELDRDHKVVGKLIAEPRKKALRTAEMPMSANNKLHLWREEWTYEKRPDNAELCTVCGLRPVGSPKQESETAATMQLRRWATESKARSRNICRVCLDRRGRRCEDWAKDLKTTIWASEVADDHGRLALFVGSLDLDGWLDGTLLSTIPITEDHSKTPSPARLYRITQAARAFWQEVIGEITPNVVGQTPFRLALHPQDKDLPFLQEQLGSFHTYEMEFGGLVLEVVWDAANGRFLTAENLAYFARRSQVQIEELTQRIEGNHFKIFEPSVYGKTRREVLCVHIVKVDKLGDCNPAIHLITEPGMSMFLVPAGKALALARMVMRHYESLFGRIRDRLPMHLGLVFFHRSTPIRAVMEAGRNMLKMGGKWRWEAWNLMDTIPVYHDQGNEISLPGARKLTFENGIIWQIPVVTGDDRITDIWYPNFLIQEPQLGTPVPKDSTRHVAELLPGAPQIPPDKVFVRPSRFDFEFLDTSARRFEIYYDEKGRRPQRPTRPFLLEDLDRFSQIWTQMEHLAFSQRYQIIQTIEATREAWFGQDRDNKSWDDPVFAQFVQDSLAGALWGDTPWNRVDAVLRRKIVQAGVKGELADLAELHMEIMKERQFREAE